MHCYERGSEVSVHPETHRGREPEKGRETVLVGAKMAHSQIPREPIINSIKEFKKVARYKASNEKSVEFTCTNKNLLKGIINETIPSTTATTWIK